ncbi:MAG TPA: NAD(P)H-hydrate dehydratase [bacterium]|nr:NAD(P)H-hydrate dehydratase [bacterium]
MKLPTPSEMAGLERRCQEACGISVAALMEQAGARTAEVARTLLRISGGRRVVVLVGKGNNGGDGLVAARHLAGDGPTSVVLLAPREEIRGLPATHLEALRERSVSLEDAASLVPSALEATLGEADLIIDAIFGTGFRGPAGGLPARVIEAANASGAPILAVDLPSGVDAASGRADPPCIRAAATVAMALPKVGTMQYPAAAHAGHVYVADIGIPDALVREAAIPTSLTTARWVDRTLPRRPADSHKGRFGRIAIVAGARGFAGAAVLAARGAIRAGAGLVTVGLPASLAAMLPAALPEAMTRALPETAAGTLSEEAGQAVIEFAAASDVVAVGPGLTTHPEVVALVRRVLPQIERPIVVDADGLNAFEGAAGLLADLPGPLVITPHPGEMARLLGRGVPDVESDRLQSARAAARLVRGIVILKGARSVVASPDGRASIIPTGNPAMATGGMGDVLTGAVAAFLGAGLPPFEAAACAAYLHGLAGNLAAAARGELGLLAHEVADEIPRALADVRSGRVDEGISAVP